LECAPEGGELSGCGFDRLPGVMILELYWAEIAECGVESSGVVDLVNEVGKVG
jgi:hypothetical protein